MYKSLIGCVQRSFYKERVREACLWFMRHSLWAFQKRIVCDKLLNLIFVPIISMKKVAVRIKKFQTMLDNPYAKWSLFRVQHPWVVAWARIQTFFGNAFPSVILWLMISLWLKDGFSFAFAAFIGVVLYKFYKKIFSRPRPFQKFSHILPHTLPPDEFSFPSGHTCNATLMAFAISSHYPHGVVVILCMMWVLGMAASRIILGMHYPSDVIMGVALGFFLGSLVIL